MFTTGPTSRFDTAMSNLQKRLLVSVCGTTDVHYASRFAISYHSPDTSATALPVELGRAFSYLGSVAKPGTAEGFARERNVCRGPNQGTASGTRLDPGATGP